MLHCNDIADAATFSVAETPGSRAHTTESVEWSATAVGGGFQASPDIAACVQEVIDLVGWASDNALAVLTIAIPEVSQSGCRMYDYAGNVSGAKFNCSYTEGGGTEVDISHEADTKIVRYSLSWGLDEDAEYAKYSFSGHSSEDDTEIVYDKDPTYGDIIIEKN